MGSGGGPRDSREGSREGRRLRVRRKSRRAAFRAGIRDRTLEEMFACKLLCRARPGSTLLCARHVPDGVEDHLLRKSDRHPNAKGAELLGLRIADLAAEGAAANVAAPPKDAALLAVGFDYADRATPLEKFFERFSKTVVIVGARERAHAKGASCSSRG